MISDTGQRDTVVKWFQDKLKHWNSSEQGRNDPVKLELMDSWGPLALQGKPSFVRFVRSPLNTNISRSQGSFISAKPDIV
jgi:hypothetical protein